MKALVSNLKRYAIWWVLVGLVLLLTLLSDVFLTPDNLMNVLRQVSINGVVAVGMTFVLIGGNFDLSVGYILGLAAVMAIQLQPTTPLATAVAILLPLVVGTILGLGNGFLIGNLGANSIVVTVGTGFAIQALTLLYVGGQHVSVWEADPSFVTLGSGYVLGVPIPAIVFLVVALCGHFLLTRTTYGQYLYASGDNPTAAALAGVPVKRTRALTFVLAGLTAAIGGIMLAARVRNLDPTAGAGYEFDALTAAILGGTSVNGGRGSVVTTIAGVIILGILSNAMTLLNISYNYQLVIRGVILVAAVSIDIMARRGSR